MHQVSNECVVLLALEMMTTTLFVPRFLRECTDIDARAPWLGTVAAVDGNIRVVAALQNLVAKQERFGKIPASGRLLILL